MKKGEVNAHTVFEQAIRKVLGLGIYEDILSKIRTSVDLSADADFQKEFTWFYKLRHGKEWNAAYYKVFEEMRQKKAKGEAVAIRDIIERLNAITGDNRIDLSFASKMLASLNPDMPIYDKFVAKNLDLVKLPDVRTAREGRIAAACAVYDDLARKSSALLKDPAITREIAFFDKVLPSYAWIRPMKKLDFLLWANH